MIGLVAIVLLVLLIGWISGFDKTSGGEIAVVRNGGMFDNHKVRQVVDWRVRRVSLAQARSEWGLDQT